MGESISGQRAIYTLIWLIPPLTQFGNGAKLISQPSQAAYTVLFDLWYVKIVLLKICLNFWNYYNWIVKC